MAAALEIVTDTAHWQKLLDTAFDEPQDVYFKPALFDIYAKQYTARFEAVFYEDDAMSIFYPYLVRDIKNISFFSKLKGDFFDITTPYGYGGPLVKLKQQSDGEQNFSVFREQFEQYARRQNYVTEFIRFHPIIENHRFFGGDPNIVQLGSVAIMDIALPPEVLYKRFAVDKRRGIQKAERAGVRVEFVHTVTNAHIEEFLAIYRETMDKNTAEEKYYFTTQQIKEFCAALGSKIFLVRALLGETCISSYLVFQDGAYLTNYLSGHLQAYRQFYPKYKVIWELTKYGHAQGGRFYNLGGGRPSLLSFKTGFSTELKPFYVGKKILDKDKYETLLALTQLGENEKDFFPRYRHKGLYSGLI